MIKIGDYVGFAQGYEGLRGIIVRGPRIEEGHSQYCVMWEPRTIPPHWNARPNGSWEDGSNIKVLSSLETRWV